MNELANNQQIQVYIKDLSDFTAQVNSLVITSDDLLAQAGDILKFVKNKIKMIDEKRKEYVKPFNDGVKRINADFKKPIETAEKLKAIIEGKIVAYVQVKQKESMEQEAKRKEDEARQLREEAETEKELAELLDEGKNKAVADANIKEIKASMIENQPVQAVKISTQGNFSSTTIKKIWSFEVLTQDIVPREFLIVDEQKIKYAIKCGVRKIEGINIFEKESIVSR